MYTNWEEKWNKIYKEFGEIQVDIVSTVKVATEVFKQNNCKNIMDLGCGTGRHSIYLASHGFKVYATDISEIGLKIAKSKADKLNLKNIEYKQHDMRDIPFDDNSLDGVLCVWTTGSGTLEDSRKNVNEIYRVLKGSGVVVIDYGSTDDETYGKGEEIEKNTFINNFEGEKDMPCHYSTFKELEELYSNFSDVQIKPIEYNSFDKQEKKRTMKAFLVTAIK